MDILDLKGGNALDIVHEVALRSSKDIDFSIENDFSKDEFEAIKAKFNKVGLNPIRVRNAT